MMKMLVELDIPYCQNDLWNEVDNIFADQKCKKEIQSNGAMLYTGNPNSNNNFAEFGVLYVKLSDNERFIKHIKKWTLFDNEDDESLPLQETNILKELEIFKKTYNK